MLDYMGLRLRGAHITECDYIHSSNIYIAPLQEKLLRGAPNSSAAKKNSLQMRKEREREIRSSERGKVIYIGLDIHGINVTQIHSS